MYGEIFKLVYDLLIVLLIKRHVSPYSLPLILTRTGSKEQPHRETTLFKYVIHNKYGKQCDGQYIQKVAHIQYRV